MAVARDGVTVYLIKWSPPKINYQEPEFESGII